jgi:hypothetical protein
LKGKKKIGAHYTYFLLALIQFLFNAHGVSSNGEKGENGANACCDDEYYGAHDESHGDDDLHLYTGSLRYPYCIGVR